MILHPLPETISSYNHVPFKLCVAPADIDSPMPSSEHETTSDSVTSPEVKETPLVEDHVTDKVEDKAEDKQEDKAEGEQEEEEEEAEGKTKGKEEEGKPEGDDIQGETENNKPELTEVTAEDQPSGIGKDIIM